jgi:hypothetical protein
MVALWSLALGLWPVGDYLKGKNVEEKVSE